MDALQHFENSVYIRVSKCVTLNQPVAIDLKVKVGFHQFHRFFVYILKENLRNHAILNLKFISNGRGVGSKVGLDVLDCSPFLE